MTECHNGREHLIQQLMTEVESLVSAMEALTESLQDSEAVLISVCSSANLGKSVPSPQTLQKRLLQVLSTLSQQTKSLSLSLQPKEEKDTFMNSLNRPKLYPCLDGSCPQCN